MPGDGNDEAIGQAAATSAAAANWLSSGHQSFDQILGLGIRRGCVTEVSGPRATGKTRLAILLSCRVLETKGEVLYLDTERSVTPERFLRADTSVCANLHRIRCYQPCSASELLALAYCLEANVIDTRKVALVVLDSIASVIRGELVPDRYLARLGLLLQKFAHRTRAAVLVINHVSIRSQHAQSFHQVPSIERIWASACTARIQLLEGNEFIVRKGLLHAQIFPEFIETCSKGPEKEDAQGGSARSLLGRLSNLREGSSSILTLASEAEQAHPS
jgi:hypothetical protein